MAYFDPIYVKVLQHEGWYANLKGDQGGQTYAGIARNFHGSWPGWRIVDSVIALRGGVDLPNNHYINDPLLNQYVRDFYLDIWNKSMAGYISNQDVAYLYFDFYVNSRFAIREIQKALNALGLRVSVDNVPGMQTINAINNFQDQNRLHDTIKSARIAYLNEVAQYGSNASFLPGWMNRIAQFPDFTTGQKTTIAIGTIMALAIVGYYLYKK